MHTDNNNNNNKKWQTILIFGLLFHKIKSSSFVCKFSDIFIDVWSSASHHSNVKRPVQMRNVHLFFPFRRTINHKWSPGKTHEMHKNVFVSVTWSYHNSNLIIDIPETGHNKFKWSFEMAKNKYSLFITQSGKMEVKLNHDQHIVMQLVRCFSFSWAKKNTKDKYRMLICCKMRTKWTLNIQL